MNAGSWGCRVRERGVGRLYGQHVRNVRHSHVTKVEPPAVV